MQNIIITLILALSVFSIYENKAFAQQNEPYGNEALAPQNDPDELVFFVNNSLLKKGQKPEIIYYISKQKLSEKITDMLNSVTLTENIEKIHNDGVISFSVTYVNGDVFNDVQCIVGFLSHIDHTDSEIHLTDCQSNETIFKEKRIVIPYRDVAK